MMDEVLQKYGHLTANQLVAKTHKEGTLWYNAAKEHELLEPFTQHECNNSDYQTALSLALQRLIVKVWISSRLPIY